MQSIVLPIGKYFDSKLLTKNIRSHSAVPTQLHGQNKGTGLFLPELSPHLFGLGVLEAEVMLSQEECLVICHWEL